ncbi:MAG: hypothetical protein M3680_36010 [Myxococcota bacterium]|nr:hypothetical protein [Myxococcota bacterium]
MRALLVLALLAATSTAAAGPQPLKPFPVRAPEAIVVAMDFERAPDEARHVLDGKITKLTRDKDGIHRVTLGRQRFEVGLPPNVKLPLRVGDRIRAELWVDRGKLHARVTDARGVPLVFMNELPDGWTMTIGDVATERRDRAPIYQHRIELTAPNTPTTTFAGWLGGDIDGQRYVVYAEARVVNEAEAAKLGVKVAWSRSLFSGVVRVR